MIFDWLVDLVESWVLQLSHHVYQEIGSLYTRRSEVLYGFRSFREGLSYSLNMQRSKRWELDTEAPTNTGGVVS